MATENAEKAPQPGSDHIEDYPAPRPILETLARLRGGNVMDLASIELNRVVKGVAESKAGKGGELIIKLKISPVPRAHRAVEVQAVIIGKAPEDPPNSDLLFFDNDGNLHTANPDQNDLFGEGPKGA